jgi:hypothetical protein
LGTLSSAASAQAAAPAKEPAKPAAPAAEKPASAPAPAAKPADAKPKPPDKKTRDAARKAYGAGEKAYGAGDYSTALENFKKANDLIPAPHSEYWIASSLDKLGRVDEAIVAYEAFLAGPEAAKVGDDKLADAKARHAALKASLVGEVTLTTVPATAQVSVDGVAQPGQSPFTLKLAPGAHKVAVTAEGYEPKTMDLDVKGGDKTQQTLELSQLATPEPMPAAPPPAAPPPPPPAPPPPPERSKVPAYVTLGIAGASAAVGTFFGIQALSAKSDFNDDPTSDTADDVERNALIADMAFGVAITLGVTGIVLLTSSDEPAQAKATPRVLPKRAALRVTPYASPKGGGAAARWTF